MYGRVTLLAGSFVALVTMQSSAAAKDLVAANTSTVLFPAIAPLVPAPATAAGAAPAAEAVPTPTFTRPTMSAAQSIGRPLMLPALLSRAGRAAGHGHALDDAGDLARRARSESHEMQGVVNNKGAMLAVKAGVAASTILMSECLWKKVNRTGAIVSMIIANSVTAVVVAHNYRLSNQLAHLEHHWWHARRADPLAHRA